jgi:hypothetical protein
MERKADIDAAAVFRDAFGGKRHRVLISFDLGDTAFAIRSADLFPQRLNAFNGGVTLPYFSLKSPALNEVANSFSSLIKAAKRP